MKSVHILLLFVAAIHSSSQAGDTQPMGELSIPLLEAQSSRPRSENPDTAYYNIKYNLNLLFNSLRPNKERMAHIKHLLCYLQEDQLFDQMKRKIGEQTPTLKKQLVLAGATALSTLISSLVIHSGSAHDITTLHVLGGAGLCMSAIGLIKSALLIKQKKAAEDLIQFMQTIRSGE